MIEPTVERRWQAWLALVVIVTHGLLLLNDAVFWDGHLIASGCTELELLRRTFVDAGAALAYPLHAGLCGLPGFPFAFKLTTFVASFVAAFAARAIARQSGTLGPAESAFVGALVATWPALLSNVEIIMVPYAVSLASLLVGWAILTSTPKVGWGPRLGAILCVFASFAVRSLLVLHLAFVALVVVRRALEKPSEEPVLVRLGRELGRHLDLLVLPFLYWFGNEALFPRGGDYANYNRVKLAPSVVLRALGSSTLTAFVRWPLASLKAIAMDPVALTVTALVAATGARLSRRDEEEPVGAVSQPAAGPFFAVGALLFAAGIVPYALVGLAPDVSGWGRRHGLVSSVGAAILTLAALALARRRLSARWAGVLRLVPIGWIAVNSGAMVDGYLGWQSRAAKDKAIVLLLKTTDEARRASTLIVRDDRQRGNEPDYRFYEWASMTEQAWGDERHVGFSEATWRASFPASRKHFNHAHNAGDFDPDGCAALVEIVSTDPREPDWRLGFRYSWARLTRRVDDPWLAGLLRLSATPFPAADGQNCQRNVRPSP